MPIIVTPLPFLKEYGIKDGENAKYTKIYVPEPRGKWKAPYSRKEKLYHAGFVNVVKEIKEEEKCITKSK